MTAAELGPFTVHRPGGPAVYLVTAADRRTARAIYRWQAYEARTGDRLPMDDPLGQARRRLARAGASLYLAVRHHGIPPTPDHDPSTRPPSTP